MRRSGDSGIRVSVRCPTVGCGSRVEFNGPLHLGHPLEGTCPGCHERFHLLGGHLWSAHGGYDVGPSGGHDRGGDPGRPYR